ncbi:hypothetical protein F4703DRAFT_1878160 [Phycomyces blakesleeanus]
MLLQRLRFILYIVLLAFIPKCYAPPIEQDDVKFTSKLPVVSILRTVLLGYMTHIVTIRPRTGVSGFSTIFRRLLALLYPSSGIGTAIESMYKSFNGDKILGISQYTFFDKATEKKDGDSHYPNNKASSDSLLLIKASASECEKDEEENTESTDAQELHLEVSRLRDRLVQDAKNKNIDIKEYDNAPYLAAFLHVIGPEQAKKTKGCILNRSVTIGFNNVKPTIYMLSSRVTNEISVTGPGAACKNQAEILPKVFRYMSDSMIDQLETAHNMDETSYVEILVTIGQLFFTTIECMDIDGDRWAKVIIIIYTSMSVLQTGSLIALHKQTMAYSIKNDGRENMFLNSKVLTLTEEERKLLGESTNKFESNEEVVILSTFTGIVVFLLIGIWADYSSHSITEWLVLAWILSPILAALGFFTFICNNSDIMLYLILVIASISSIGCLIAATIIGYLPKENIIISPVL